MRISESGRQVLTGKWGGSWEFISAKYFRARAESTIKLYKVKSLRTGYFTWMREDSFLPLSPVENGQNSGKTD